VLVELVDEGPAGLRRALGLVEATSRREHRIDRTF
jgi:hypothetical protein